ncbi:hypothetical protein L9F63_023853 [Diploptera punctata]|uniref:CHK kinase-like domain-containing protein n=1 Tax=Diploptera punctata TaxID=6984 RepID=A0AAD7ZI55_DIPPU|nr:hypothetical protein L9F63_023853 [Diploptera punctata]
MPETNSTTDMKLSWLNNTFLEKVVKTSEEDDSLRVTSFDLGRATAAGDNYSSVMYRVKVHYTTRGHSGSRSFVIKTLPTTEKMAEMIKESNVFQRESDVISKIAPRVYDILQKASEDRKKTQPFAAKCIYSQLEYPDVIIVLEDLKEEGFRMAERTEGLDMDHCLLVLRTLAKYHAATAVLYEQDPQLFENRSGKICITTTAVDYVIKSYQKQDGDFNVLTHGDLWLNNMMFRYSESTGRVQDIRFVDFQLVNVTSAAFDLHYFLSTSPSPNLLKKHDILIEEYHKTLEETFALLDHKHLHPPIEKLKKELDKKGLFAVIIACTLLPFVLVEHSKVPDIDKVLKNEEGVKFSKKYLETLEKMVPIFEEKGWLDVEKFLKE